MACKEKSTSLRWDLVMGTIEFETPAELLKEIPVQSLMLEVIYVSHSVPTPKKRTGGSITMSDDSDLRKQIEALQTIRSESFNFTNHTNPANPNSRIDCQGQAGHIFGSFAN